MNHRVHNRALNNSTNRLACIREERNNSAARARFFLVLSPRSTSFPFIHYLLHARYITFFLLTLHAHDSVSYGETASNCKTEIQYSRDRPCIVVTRVSLNHAVRGN